MFTKRVEQVSRAYKTVFNTDGAEQCLADLAVFCGAKKSSFSRDSLEMARAEGRREVWLRIQAQLNLSEKDIFDLLRRSGYNNQQEDNN
jgi:hypothetical protein